MAQYKTPGVYIVEKDAFPNSVVEVPTAVPAFMGFTEKADRNGQSLFNTPVRLTSLTEFTRLFGGAPKTRFKQQDNPDNTKTVVADPASQFLLYNSLRIFFDNGGSTCWIVSVGSYVGDTGEPTAKVVGPFETALKALEKEQEPTMLVAPDAVLLTRDEWAKLSNQMLAQSIKMQSRVAILDVYDGFKRRDGGDDVIAKFRGAGGIAADDPAFAMAYYPWLNTSIQGPADVDYRSLTPTYAGELAALVEAELTDDDADDDDKQHVADMVSAITTPPAKELDARRKHQALMTLSFEYRKVMEQTLQASNLLPPSGAMAGVMSRIDATVGVWKAPANVPIASVVSPCLTISDDEQNDLNVPLSGKAINAIRTFTGRGVLVWGARTLDSNSQDWRYISVRRTMIFLEQSIKTAAQAYVFSPNTSSTWVTVANMIRNFLNNQWKAGALAGATPGEAYEVSVGLGSTMTANDILDGYMNVTVKVAVSRPAEFIVITFQQKMQTS